MPTDWPSTPLCGRIGDLLSSITGPEKPSPCSEAALALGQDRRDEAPMDLLDEMVAHAQGIGWKIAIVRAIHGADADALSIDELLAEFDRLQRTSVVVTHADGSTETMTELRLRLEYARAP